MGRPPTHSNWDSGKAVGVAVRLKLLTDWLVYFLVRVIICVMQTLRIETCHWLAHGLSILACDVVRLRYRVVDENLQHAFPTWDARTRQHFIRRMWEHLFLMVAEVAQVRRTIHEMSWKRFVTFRDKPLLVGYLLDPRPTVLVTGHYGNFEVAGYVLGMFGFPSFTIARKLDNPFLDRFINRFRGSTGQFILPKQGCAPQVEAVLQMGGTLSLLGDQHAGDKGCWVEFLGRPASCHKAVALFTLTSGAPQIVSYLRRTGRPLHFEIGVAGVADPRTWDSRLAGVKPLTRWYNERLEELILEAPEQYWWVHRRWKGQPPQRRDKPVERPRDAKAA
ncbi:MAG: lysophospholipid acyltransferase family protein [Pirellulaceae bacterium]|nr:lysophospholipid acyltransferase family protein [Pirellulaceae bacterium]